MSSIGGLRELYATGRISIDELEQRLEPVLLRTVPRDYPLPDGWEPLPPCDHDWLDITTIGQDGRSLLCAICGDRDFA